MSQSALAKDLGITKSALSMYERNERRPRDEIKLRFAKYFKLSIEEIFYNEQ